MGIAVNTIYKWGYAKLLSGPFLSVSVSQFNGTKKRKMQFMKDEKVCLFL
jgi:hypothetical protein